MQEQESLPVDGLIIYEKKVLEKVNPFQTKFNELRELHKDAPDLTTTKGKEEMRKQIKAFRDLKGDTEEARKLDKAAINKFAKIVDENYGGVWDEAEREQKDRDAKLKEQIAKEEAEKKAKEEAQQKIKISRLAELNKLGISYAVKDEAEHVLLGSFNIAASLIGTSTEEVWENHILKGFKEQADIIEQERLAEEKRKQDEADKLRQEQEELRQEQEEFKKQQEKLKRQKEEFEAKQREAWRLQINARLNQLDGNLEQVNGVSGAVIAFKYKGHTVLTEDDLLNFSDEDFNEVRDIHNKRVAEDQEREAAEKEAEEKRLAAEAKKTAIEIARKSLLLTIGITDHPDHDLKEMSESEWDRTWDVLKHRYDTAKHEEWLEMERVKKIQEEELEKERQADLNDGQKWREWKGKLQNFAAHMPEFKSKRYSKMKAIALEKFSEIQLLRTDKISSN